MDSAPILREELKVYPYREPLRCVSARSQLAPVTKQLWTLSIVYGSYEPQTTLLIHARFQTKIGSPFVEGSPESSENSAFDRALIEGASYFCFQMRVEILSEPWNPWNARILAISQVLPEPQEMASFWKTRFYTRNHQQSTEFNIYYIGRFGGLPKTDLSYRQDLKIMVPSHFRTFLN